MLPLGDPEADDVPDPVVRPTPAGLIGERVREWVEERGEEGMRAMIFAPFWATRPDRTGNRAFLPMPFSTGHSLGWLLEADEGTAGLVGRPARLREGEELPYAVRAAVPIAEGRYLVGHEEGVTLLEETDAR